MYKDVHCLMNALFQRLKINFLLFNVAIDSGGYNRSDISGFAQNSRLVMMTMTFITDEVFLYIFV